MIVRNAGKHFGPAQDLLIMEHIPNGELFDLLASREPVSAGTSRRLLRDVISGMAACYRSGVSHRNLKPESLLIKETGRVVIIGFGHAKLAAHQGDTNTDAYGALGYAAPEVERAMVAGIPYNYELADVWSLGVISFCLHAKRPLFRQAGGAVEFRDVVGDNNEKMWQVVEMGTHTANYYPAFPDDLKRFISSLLRKEPTDRPSFGELERAIMGDLGVLNKFPGLRWLAEPLNDEGTFLGELSRLRPDLVFQPAQPA
jgi:serine/threonine protein kinase